MNLAELTPQVLTELTNVGTVRRAAKDLEVAITWSEGPGGALIAEAADGTVARLGPGPFADWECSCPAMFGCRHLVRAVLIWQRDHPVGSPAAATDAAAVPTPPGSAGSDAATQDAPATIGDAPGSGTTLPATVGLGTTTGQAHAAPVAHDLFGSRLRAQGERLATDGITARVTTVPRLRVRVLHPFDIGVRYPLGTDARYARCECGAGACVHLYLAERARELAAPALAGSTAVLVDTTSPATDRIDATGWHLWLDQLLEVGLGAADALIGGAVRLASSWEAQEHVHPAAALRDIITQLEHHRAHDAQLSPERLLLLIGEVEARLRALAFEGPAPHAVVAGRADTQVSSQAGRLLGLGASWQHVGGWNALRVFLLDVRTGAVVTLTAEREDTPERLVQPADLLAQRRHGRPLADWAVGNALVPRFRRVGDTLAVGRTRVAVAPSPGIDLAGLAAVLPESFADVAAQLSGVPGPLGPRRPSDGVWAVPVTGVSRVRVDATSTTVHALLHDAAGGSAALLLPWGPRTQEGARRLVGLLEAGGLTAVAGRWSQGEDGLEVTPTAVWVEGGVFLPQVDQALGCDPMGPARLPSVEPDPWQETWRSLAEPLGRLLILGGRRGASSAGTDLHQVARDAEERGLSRLAGQARTVAEAVVSPAQRRRVFADTCVLLTFAA